MRETHLHPVCLSVCELGRPASYLMSCCLRLLCLQERVLQCQGAIQSMATPAINTVPPKSASGRASPAPQSPVGVLDAGCLSYKSDDDATAAATVASHGASAYGFAASSPVTSKRRKITTR
jgi:cyclin D1/2/4